MVRPIQNLKVLESHSCCCNESGAHRLAAPYMLSLMVMSYALTLFAMVPAAPPTRKNQRATCSMLAEQDY